MNERKNIIISFRSNLGQPKKGIDNRVSFLKAFILINSLITILAIGITGISIISEILNLEIIVWENNALLIILSLSSVLNLSNELYEIKLLQHLKFINLKSDCIGINKLNKELKNIIYNLNVGIKKDWALIVFIVIIFISGIWEMGFSHNPYWEYIKYCTILFYMAFILKSIHWYKQLNKNINTTEINCS